eukprot:7344198-Alexandrium_andersonii.AAC.1
MPPKAAESCTRQLLADLSCPTASCTLGCVHGAMPERGPGGSGSLTHVPRAGQCCLFELSNGRLQGRQEEP